MSCRAAILLLFCGQWVAAQQSGGAQPAGSSSGGGAQPAGEGMVLGQTDDSGNQENDFLGNAGLAPVPMPAAISSEPLVFAPELSRSNYLRGGLTLGTSYDDNILNASSDEIGGFTYSVLPSVSFDMTRSRMRWQTDYSVGLTMVEHLSSRNQDAQNLGTDLQLLLSPHVRLDLNDHFSVTSGFYANSNDVVPGSGVLQQPNDFVITPLAKTTTNTGAAALTYQFSATSMVGANGNGNITRYSDETPGTTLLDSNSYGASGFYSYRLTPRNWVGVRYGYQHFSVDSISQTTDDQTIMLFDTIYLKKNMQLSIFGGPDHTKTDTTLLLAGTEVPISEEGWQGAGGVNFSWQGQHTTATADFVRRVNDGGGLQGPVTLTSVSGGLSQQLTKTITVGVGASYSNNDALSQAITSAQSVATTSGSVSLSKTFRQNFNVSLGYSRDHQRQTDSASVDTLSDHNRGWINISYSFSRPLGR